MPFRYRLQKILDFRIRKKEEQLLVVQKAQYAVYEAEERIRQNEEEIQQTIQNRRTSDYKLMEYYDKYLHHHNNCKYIRKIHFSFPQKPISPVCHR